MKLIARLLTIMLLLPAAFSTNASDTIYHWYPPKSAMQAGEIGMRSVHHIMKAGPIPSPIVTLMVDTNGVPVAPTNFPRALAQTPAMSNAIASAAASSINKSAIAGLGFLTNSQSGATLPSLVSTNATLYDTGGKQVIDNDGLHDADGSLIYDRSQKKFYYSAPGWPDAANWVTGDWFGDDTAPSINFLKRQAYCFDEILNMVVTNIDWTSRAALKSSLTNAGLSAADSVTAQLATKLTAAGGTGTSNTLLSANIPAGDLIVSWVFDNQHPINIWMLASYDYTNWAYVSTTPVLKQTVPFLGAFTGGFYRDPRPFVYNGTNYLSLLVDNQNAVLFESTDLINWKTNQVLNQPMPSGRFIRWEPHWFIDTNNVLYCYTSQAGSGQDAFGFYTNFVPYVMYLTNLSDMRSWSTQVPLSGTWWSNSIAPEVVRVDGRYWMFQTQEGTPSFSTNAYTCVSVATNPLGPWSLVLTNDWAGWGALAEGPMPLKMSNGDWILYSCKYGGGGNFAATCPASGFPTNGWSARQIMTAPYGFDDPGYLLVTNLIAQNAIYRYALSKKSLDQPVQFWGDNYQTVSYCGNTYSTGTNYGWNQLDSFYTNRYGMQILYDTYNGVWAFETLGKGGLRSGTWDDPPAAPTIKPSGFNIGGSVMGRSSVTSGKFIMTNCTTLPTMTENDVAYVASNKVVYVVSSTKTNILAPTSYVDQATNDLNTALTNQIAGKLTPPAGATNGQMMVSDGLGGWIVAQGPGNGQILTNPTVTGVDVAFNNSGIVSFNGPYANFAGGGIIANSEFKMKSMWLNKATPPPTANTTYTVINGYNYNLTVVTPVGTNMIFNSTNTSLVGPIYYPMTTNAPTAAQIGGTVGSVTNHIIKNVNGGIIDYWSDGTTVWAKQLSP